MTNAAGYVGFVNSGYKMGIIGSSHGRGLAVNNATKKEVYMRNQEYQVGLGLVMEIGIKGTNYYRDKSFYPEEKKSGKKK